MFLPFTQEDWELILPFLEENERLFGITINTLLAVDGRLLSPSEVYRKVVPTKIGEMLLAKTAGPVNDQNPVIDQNMETETVGDLL